MSNDTNPMAVQNIRAAGTPLPGKRQGKKPTKAQAEKQTKADMLIQRIAKLEQGMMQLSQVLQQHEQQVRIGGLERHVALAILEQQVGRETIESLMNQRAEHFGLKVSFDKEGEANDENSTNESDQGGSSVSANEEYTGTEDYS